MYSTPMNALNALMNAEQAIEEPTSHYYKPKWHRYITRRKIESGNFLVG